MKNETLYLPAEVALIPVNEISEANRQSFTYNEDDFVVTHQGERSVSKIIDAAAAGLLNEFRKPRSLVEAVYRFAVLRQLEPQTILPDAWELIKAFRKDGFLVYYDDFKEKRKEGLLENGAQLKGYTVVKNIARLSGTEVYQIQKDTTLFALKILSPGKAGPALEVQFENELSILGKLNGIPAPALIESWSETGNQWLVSAWIEGKPLLEEAANYRNFRDGQQLLSMIHLACSVTTAYRRLHDKGCLHGDIHSNNILITAEGSAMLIDFGLGKFIDDQQFFMRGGVAFYFEPEYANCFINRQPVPGASPLGEQYAISALLYEMFTGKQYLPFSVEKETMFAQIINDQPIPFERYDIDIDPRIEAIISKGLSKDPADRFGSMAEMAFAFKQVESDLQKASLQGLPRQNQSFSFFCKTLTNALGLNGSIIDKGLQLAPTASVNYGAAGIAYMFYRMACLENDSRLLATADIWLNHAKDPKVNPEDAYYSADMDMSAATIGKTSIYHSPSGPQLVQSLVCSTMGDRFSFCENVIGFINASASPVDNLDITIGISSTILGCALLQPHFEAQEIELQDQLGAFGQQQLDKLWQTINSYKDIAQETQVEYRGIAHGWAGYLYATLQYAMAFRKPFPDRFFDRVEQLLSLLVEEMDYVRWGLTAKDAASWPGWCHGAAGYCFLLCKLYEYTHDERYIRLAEKSARYMIVNGKAMTNGNLCCGLGGQAYALLSLYNTTGENSYLQESKQFAANTLKHVYGANMKNNSLYKGEVGAAVLFSELSDPSFARMPLFE